jgi:hypothetical protein
MRCKACDIKIERVGWNKAGKRLEDLCRVCRELVYLPPTTDELVFDDGYLLGAGQDDNLD